MKNINIENIANEIINAENSCDSSMRGVYLEQVVYEIDGELLK